MRGSAGSMTMPTTHPISSSTVCYVSPVRMVSPRHKGYFAVLNMALIQAFS